MDKRIRLNDEELTAISDMVLERLRCELRESERLWKESTLAERIRRRLKVYFG